MPEAVEPQPSSEKLSGSRSQSPPSLIRRGKAGQRPSTAAHLDRFRSDVSPFGRGLQKYWDRRYEYFSKFDEGIQTDRQGLFSVTPEETALALAERLSLESVIDGFAGIGGSAIGFARSGAHVTAIDINRRRLNMAKNNAKVYGVYEAIDFIVGDFFVVAGRLSAAGVHLDPPWGGPDYAKLSEFGIEDFQPDGRRLLEFSLERFPVVALRVPRNFRMADLAPYGKFVLHEDLVKGRRISYTAIFGAAESTP